MPGDGLAGTAAIAACVCGGLLGLYAMINPRWASGLVKLVPREGNVEGKSEFRATYGGLFFVSHAFALWAAWTIQPGWHLAAGVLGAAWVGSAIGRLISFVLDRTMSALNWVNLAVEVVIGVILLLPFLSTLGTGQ
jgi:hypothetical protein